MREPGAVMFERALDEIEQAIRRLGRRRRLRPAELEEVRSFVMFKLIENDYGRLRKHQPDASLAGFVNVVVERLYLDYIVAARGKWHASAEATRRGAAAVALERLVYRDGYTAGEAVRCLTSRGYGPPERLREDFAALPVRHRVRLVPEAALPAGFSSTADPVVAREASMLASLIADGLAEALVTLDERDRLLLRLRFHDERSVPEIAEILGVSPKPLYARLRRVVGTLRAQLISAEVTGERVSALFRRIAASFDLDQVFSRAAA